MEIKLNLLSEAKKNEVRKKKRYRLVVWQEIIVVSLLLFYGLILGGIVYMHSFQIKNLSIASVSQTQEQAFQEVDSAEKKFKEVNTLVASLQKFQKEHTVWSRVLFALNEASLEGVALEKIATTNQKVSLQGVAQTRDKLLEFKERLNASSCFQNATLPLSDLFTQEDVDFQIDVEVKQDCLKPGNL